MLDITAISKTFHPGTPNARQALRQLSLHLEDGEFATIVGSNGAGKSTLFGAIAGSFYTDEGRHPAGRYGSDLPAGAPAQPGHWAAVSGPHAGDRSPHDHRGESGAGLSASLPRKPLSAASRPRTGSCSGSQLAQLDMGLEERMRQPVGLLSGGQRQALTLLMATMVPPKLLLLDEHTAALDPATADKVLELTRRIVAEHHITCLMVTHNMAQALALGSRTLMMDGGLHCAGCLRDRAGGAHGQ